MEFLDKKEQQYFANVRRIKQIAMSESSDGEGNASVSVLALCDDGSLWFRSDPWDNGSRWRRIDTREIDHEPCD